MIPPKLPIKISGETGKRLGPQRISLELLLGTAATLTYRSVGSDTATWSQASGTVAPENDEQVTFWGADGRRLLVGRATSKYRHGYGWQITVSGPFEFMEKAKLLSRVTDPSGSSAVRALKTFPKGDLTLSVRELLQMAVDQGAEFRIGEISQAFAVSQMTFKEQYFDTAFSDMLKWTADVATRIRYDTDGYPLMDVIRRGDANTVLIEMGSELNRCTFLEMDANPDLIPSSVEVQYVTRDPITYKPIYRTEMAGTPSGPSYKRQTLTVSGPENDSYLPGEKYESALLRTLSSIPWSYVKTADNLVKDVIANFGNFEMTPGDGISIQLGNSHSSPSQIKTQTPQIPKFYTTEGDLAAGYYALVEGSVPGWFSQYGTVIQGSVQGQYVFQYTGTASLEDTSEQVYELNERQPLLKHTGWYVGGADIKQNFYFYSVNLPLTLISVPYETLTEIWKQQDFEFISPPSGLAENLWRAQQWLPYDGQANFCPGAVALPSPGELLSVSGSLPDWRTAGALISSTKIDLGNGSASVKIGFPSRMSARNLLSRFKVNASDNIDQNV